MAKVVSYSVLFTVFMWLGGIASQNYGPLTAAAQEHGTLLAAPTDAGAVDVAPAHEDAGSGLMSIKWGPFFWQLILFLVLLAVLAKFVWPPILRGLQQRDEKLRGDLENAERANRDAQATLAQYKTQLAEAQKEAQRIIEQSRTDALRVASQLKEQAQADLTQMRQRAQADIESARQQAVADLYEQTAVLATQVAGQILKREIQPQDHRSLVEDSLGNLSAARN